MSVFFFDIKKNTTFWVLISKIILELCISIYFLGFLTSLSFESNSMEFCLQSKTQIKLMRVQKKKNQHKQNISLKMLEGRKILFFVFCTSKQGHTSDVTLQQDRFGKASRDEQNKIYHIEVAVLCPVQKNWLIFKSLQ